MILVCMLPSTKNSVLLFINVLNHILLLCSIGGTRVTGSIRKDRPSGTTGATREVGSRWSSRYPRSCGQWSMFIFISSTAVMLVNSNSGVCFLRVSMA